VRLSAKCAQLLWVAILTSVSVVALPIQKAVGQESSEPLDVAFKSKLDGTEQRYVVILPTGFRNDTAHDLVIALHGHGSDRWQFVKDGRGECKGSRDATAEQKMIFVSPDYRAKTSWMGPAAEADMLQMLDDLHGRYRIRDVIVSGGSMGGTSALAFAALHPECVDGVVSLNGTANLVEYPNFLEAIAESYGGSKIDKPEVYRQRSAEFFPDRLTMPVATTTGGKDTLVPPDSVLRLMEALKKQGSPALSLHRPDGSHDTNYEDTRSAFRFVIENLTTKRSQQQPVLYVSVEPMTIVCLGDSVTGVYYHTGGHRAYPEMLELALKAAHPRATIKVINAGISGNTTRDGLNRLDSDVLKHRPDLVTISFGLNDMVRVPIEEYRSNLEQLIDRCRAQKSQVLLCTPNAVINTGDRPITRLGEYCEVLRTVGRNKNVPVCDQYMAGEQLKQRAPWTRRLTMSDAIHPNMDGHKRMAEELCRVISGANVSLDEVQPPLPILPRTRKQLADGAPLRIMAMEPVATMVEAAIRRQRPDVKVELTTWTVTGKSLARLEQEANAQVRGMKPDLVVLTIPAELTVANDEQTVHSISWIMNWSLSFGLQEWDCVVVHPSVLTPSADPGQNSLIRKLVHAQHLALIDRTAESVSAAEIIQQWFNADLSYPPQ
jgi:lysophospholipase L1-like esterase/predicted esterase